MSHPVSRPFTYLLLLIGLAGALGVSLSSIQRYTSQRQASSQRSLLAAEEVHSKVILCDQNIQTLATVCDLVFYSNQQVGQGPVTLIRSLRISSRNCNLPFRAIPCSFKPISGLRENPAIDNDLLALDGLIREVEKQGGVFKDMAFSQPIWRKISRTPSRRSWSSCKTFSNRATSFQTLSQSEDAAQKSFGESDPQSGRCPQPTHQYGVPAGQPDSIAAEYETLMESISLSMRGLVDLSETSLERNRFQSEQTGIKNKSLLWGASLAICLVPGWRFLVGQTGDLQPLASAVGGRRKGGSFA